MAKPAGPRAPAPEALPAAPPTELPAAPAAEIPPPGGAAGAAGRARRHGPEPNRPRGISAAAARAALRLADVPRAEGAGKEPAAQPDPSPTLGPPTPLASPMPLRRSTFAPPARARPVPELALADLAWPDSPGVAGAWPLSPAGKKSVKFESGVVSPEKRRRTRRPRQPVRPRLSPTRRT